MQVLHEKDRVRHINGREGTVMEVIRHDNGAKYYKVTYDQGGFDILEPGWLEKIPEAFAV